MAKFYICPICPATVSVIKNEGGKVEAECMEHGYVVLEAEAMFQDAPGQMNIFGGAL